MGKLFDKYVSDRVEDALKPLMSSLKIKIPSIPGADKLKDALNGTADITKKIKTNTDSLSDVSGKLTKLFRNRQPAG